MEDKTPVYILAIVGMVAVVAVVFMLTSSIQTNTITDLNNDNGGAITGNAISEDIEPIISLNIIAKVLLAAILGGAVLHMYHKW